MKRAFVLTASAALWCFLCPPALAAGRGESAPLDLAQADGGSSAGGGGLTRTIVGLAIVIGVIFGLHWVLKQVKASREESASGEGLASLATLPLGPNRAVHVVRAGNEILVLGATEHGIAQLRVYSEDEASAAGLMGERAAAAVIEGAPARPRRLTLPLVAGGGAAGEGANVLDTLRAWTVRR